MVKKPLNEIAFPVPSPNPAWPVPGSVSKFLIVFDTYHVKEECNEHVYDDECDEKFPQREVSDSSFQDHLLFRKR
jgi:hypothetical protein